MINNTVGYAMDEDLRAGREQIRRIQMAAESQDFQAIATLPEGRRLLRRLMGECGVFQTSFTGEGLTAAHKEGKRVIGLWVLEQFSSCPDLYIQLLTEQTNDRRNSIDD
jgi:hypothetical protein